jgi:hypothetical protein
MIQTLKTVLKWHQGRTSERDDIIFSEMPPYKEDMMVVINAVYAHLERLVDWAYPVRPDIEDGTPGKDAIKCMEMINEFVELVNEQEKV